MTRERTHKRMVYGAFASFLIAILIASYMVANAFTTSRDRQISACHRGNDVRQELDDQREALIKAREVILNLVDTAKSITTDPVAYENFKSQQQQLAQIQFDRVESVDCDAVIRSQ